MIQIQRFNKALKSAVIIGDLAILNILSSHCTSYGQHIQNKSI